MTTVGADANVDLGGETLGLPDLRCIAEDIIRSLVPTLEDDRYIAEELELVAAELKRGMVLKVLGDVGVSLH
ncbi:hypothetical protein ABZ671_28965 [Micromonospora sp. NPDC006766]|uniref:hypothetical protein n=1 Tax=Micromonospora sp. NPDC006766 TaxID=3154778 RepID=UPI0033C95E41